MDDRDRFGDFVFWMIAAVTALLIPITGLGVIIVTVMEAMGI